MVNQGLPTNKPPAHCRQNPIRRVLCRWSPSQCCPCP